MEFAVFLEFGLVFRRGVVFDLLYRLVAFDLSITKIIEAAANHQILGHFDTDASLIGKTESLVECLSGRRFHFPIRDHGLPTFNRFHLGDDAEIATTASLNINAKVGVEMIDVVQTQHDGHIHIFGSGFV